MVYINEDPLDPNKNYTAEELANFIRKKILGVNTREAMARSLLKASEVAEWSQEVTQQLIDGSFDTGELNTEIERKLNELEVQYAPELTNVKTQLAETGQELHELKEVTSSEVRRLKGFDLLMSKEYIKNNPNLKNMVLNGNFMDDTEHWEALLGSTIGKADRGMRITGDGSLSVPRVRQEISHTYKAGDELYIYTDFRAETNNTRTFGYNIYGDDDSDTLLITDGSYSG